MARIWITGYTKSDGTKVPGHYRNVSSRQSGLSGKENAVLKKWHKAYDRNETAFEQGWPRKKARAAGKYFRKIDKQLDRIRRTMNRRKYAAAGIAY